MDQASGGAGMNIAEGKTKTIKPGPKENTVILETKDVLTGGDAAKREVIEGIGFFKTTQAANVFTLLEAEGLPTAFIERLSSNTLLCYQCDMLPLELVTRRYAWGTYLLRHPEYENDQGRIHRFDELVWEFFHKWSVITQPLSDKPYQMDEENSRSKYLRNGVWQKGVYTDPYIHITDAGWVLYPPKEDLSKSSPLMVIKPVLEKSETSEVIDNILIPAFRVLEGAWEKVTTDHGRVALVDLKLEVGRRYSDNKLVIADVVDNDSWRIWPGADPARQLDKQLFRENHPLSEVAENYELVTQLTECFINPHLDL